MRVSEEFTSSLQVGKASKHKGFSADYYSHSIVARFKTLIKKGIQRFFLIVPNMCHTINSRPIKHVLLL